MEENKKITSEELEKEVMKEEEERKDIEEVKEEEYDGPTVKTTVRYDFRTMKYFNVYSMLHRRHFNIIYLVMGFVPLGLGVYFITSLLMNPSAKTNTFSYVFPMIFIFMGAYFVYNALTFKKTIDKNIRMHFSKSKVITIETTVTTKTLTLVTDTVRSEPMVYNWAMVSEICEIPQYYYLFVGKMPIIIDKDPNAVIDGDFETLQKIINDKAKMKPYRLLNKEIVKEPITYVHKEDQEYDEVEIEEKFEDVTEEEKKDDQN